MEKKDIRLLRTLCGIFAPSADERQMTEFLLDYVKKNQAKWKVKPEIIHGPDFQDCVMLRFGEPRTAIFAHIDSIGFTVRYDNQLVPIGGPDARDGDLLVGVDSLGEIECRLLVDDEQRLGYRFGRAIDRGTNLVYKQDFIETQDTVQSCYLDNRLGVYAALKVAETLENGLIVFSCREEHAGGTVPFLIRYMYEKWQVRQTLIADITWVTDGVQPGKGVAISMRDSGLPRRSYLNRILDLAEESGIPYQLEVEGAGGSDAKELQASPYPIDWCFVGAPEDHVHTPDEIVNKADIAAMIDIYRYLMEKL